MGIVSLDLETDMHTQTYEALEDAYWILQANATFEEGFVGVEESAVILDKLRKKHLKDVTKRQFLVKKALYF